ncbi:hypothetical protein EVAR_89374_1 [Eumeta japonica]|uniref:Endonuclease/exonuclease/phosphatase domain-containing protein n=1 Tax=Eumeta variegata TaxID=151549 RepID=A0A4C1ZUC4_EUMVA|nr:hypothetical protein EVAR_89374_1 [Eumeta japonica]
MPGDGVAVDRIRKARGQKVVEDPKSTPIRGSRLGKGQGRYATGDGHVMTLSATRCSRSALSYHRLIKPALYTWGSKAPGMGPVPVGAVFALSRIRTWQAFLQRSVRGAHCGREHTGVTCRARKDGSPKMRKLYKGRLRGHAHGAFSSECGVRAKWDDMARSKPLFRNLYGNIGELRRYPRCRVIKDGSAEGTRQSRHNGPEQRRGRRRGSNPQRRKRRSCRNQSRNCRIGVVSVYFEETCPSARTSIACDTSAQNSGPTKSSWGDVSAWVYGGAANAMMRAVSISATSSILRAAHLERGNTPRSRCIGDRLLKSVVDVTACSSALDRAEEWQVVRDVTSSDHNAVTFAVRVEDDPALGLSGTRVYNTAKARWSEFAAAMDAALNERTLTTEMVKSVGSCDQLDEVVETYRMHPTSLRRCHST